MAESPLSPAEVAQQNRASILRIVRMVFGVLLLVATLSYMLNLDAARAAAEGGTRTLLIEQWWVPLTGAFLLGLVTLALDILTPTKKLATIAGVFFGLLFGLIASFAVSLVIDLLSKSYDLTPGQTSYFPAIKILFGIVLCYLGISAVLQTQDDLRLVIPYVEFTRQLRGPRPILLDTSAIIDARIADLAGTGIVAAPLIIPEFVLAELQRLADSQDKLKRARGRRGLEVATRLQRTAPVEVSIERTSVASIGAAGGGAGAVTGAAAGGPDGGGAPGVDQQLIELARTMSAAIATTDAALARVAGLQKIPVINIHEIAAALKPSLVPGTGLTLALVRQGEQPHQAVGYLDDGTMVVVDHGATLIGQETQIVVSSSLQTAAGRLIFARLAESGSAARPGPDPNMPAEPEATGENGAAGAPVDPDDAAAGAPRALAVPPPAAPKPGPLGPGHGPRNPLRNPRR